MNGRHVLKTASDGKPVEVLILHGGGGSVLAAYTIFLQTLFPNILHAPCTMIGSSAGALAIAWGLHQALFPNDRDVSAHLASVHEELYASVDVIKSIDGDEKSLCSVEVVRSIFVRSYPHFKSMTLRDLQERTALTFKFAVTITTGVTYTERLLCAATTPDVNVIDALLASCAVPIVFSPITIELDGSPVECADGDIIGDLYDSDVTYEAQVSVEGGCIHQALEQTTTGVAIVDHALMLLGKLIATAQRCEHHKVTRSVAHDIPIGVYDDTTDHTRYALDLASKFSYEVEPC
jgi:predicted acylesterase/phospholipase RssA